MKFTVGWLKEHLETDASVERICEVLTDIGLEVEEMEDRAKIFAPFKAAYVEKAEQHPNADRLRVCVVDTGSEKLQVVCGASNARAGMKVIFAPSGSYVPGIDMTLKKGVIRGEESNGMMVSEREMGLSDEHEGIIDLPDDIEIGTPMADIFGLNDVIIEIALTPNRADCAGIRGIARDLAAAGLGTLKPLEIRPVAKSFDNPVVVSIDEDAREACPLFLGRAIRGVKNGPSPAWLQQKLKSIGLRPISILVDITNLMTIEYNRPLHVFDMDKLNGNIHVGLSKGGEELDALNDKSYTLGEGMTVICDENGALGLGGIVGGTSTGVVDETVNVYVEAAYFDPARTARTGRDLQVSSDARYRFERGVDPEFTADGMELATKLILELCGGEASDVVKAGNVPDYAVTVAYSPDKVKSLIGYDVAADRQKEIFASLGFTVEDNGAAGWNVTPPSWRVDVNSSACLVEEVTRIEGLAQVPAISVTRYDSTVDVSEPRGRTLFRSARTALIARGMDETITWSFMSKELAASFGANDNHTPGLTLTNPISSDLDQMRPSILPNLIAAARENGRKGFADNALFENGPVFRNSSADGQALICGAIRTGNKHGKHWSTGSTARPVDVYDIKADVLAILKACGAPDNLQLSTDNVPDWYHPGRSGRLGLGRETLAYFGEIHPAILAEMDMEGAGPVVACEVFLESIPEPRRKGTHKPLLKLSPLQPVHRDFAFVLDEGVAAQDLVRAVQAADKNLITSVTVFDVYRGKGVEDGKKSLAIAVTFQPAEQTLTDSELEGISRKITDTVAQKTGGVLRG
jgi:phenylalanyl-tRNA synthetase beta chain